MTKAVLGKSAVLDFIDKQEPLSTDFERVLYANLRDLYIRGP